jgi:uncharacterized membrane protein
VTSLVRRSLKEEAPEWLASHYQFQIRTFWIGRLYLVFAALTSFIVIGFAVGVFWNMWLIIRSVKGMKVLDKGVAPENVTGLLF